MSKLLNKVSLLLNQAENASTPEEAAAFMAKAQEMASLNAIDLTVARMHQAKKEKVQEPEERRIEVNPHARKRNRKHFMELAMVIADVNDVKYLIGGKETALHAVGFPSDLDVVEALYTHLSVQMAAEADEAIANEEHKELRNVLITEKVELAEEERAWGEWDDVNERYYDDHPAEKGEEVMGPHGRWRVAHQPPKHKRVPVLDADGNEQFEEKKVDVVDARVFRGNFYESFVMRMRGRLWEMKHSAERQKGVSETDAESSTAIALRDKKEEVNKAHEEQRAQVRHLGEYKSAADTGRRSDYTGTAQRAGTTAADRVPVGETGRGVKKAK